MKVLEVLLNYNRFYLWSLKNLAYSDSTESNRFVKDWISMFHGVTLRKRRKGDVVRFNLECAECFFELMMAIL